MVAIKDMKMPSSCYDCPFIKNERTNDYGSFCECGILEDCETINLLEHSKHPNCPLIEQEPILDKVKQAREEIENEVKFFSEPCKYNVESVVNARKAKAQSYKHCLEILDRLIESEG